MPESAFSRKFLQDIKRVNKTLEAYNNDPGREKNIHDIRVAIRRLYAIFSLLPKKARKPYRGKIEKYVKLLKANSKARDCDIIAGRLLIIGAPTMADLENKKKNEIARAVRITRSLGKLPLRLVGAPDEKRLAKMINKLVGKIEISLPLVLSDERRITELHKLRRDLRKLRYILGLAKAGNKRIVMKKLAQSAGTEIKLKELQN